MIHDTDSLTALYEAEYERFEDGEGTHEPRAFYTNDTDTVIVEVIDADGRSHYNDCERDELSDLGWAADARRVAP